MPLKVRVGATLAVPFCYVLEDILVAALPGGSMDLPDTVTGISVAAAALLMPATLATGSLIDPSEALSQDGVPFLPIAGLSAFSNVRLIFTIRTTGAVVASQAGHAMTAGGILWSDILLNEAMSIWIWAALACLVSGPALVMPELTEDPRPEWIGLARSSAADEEPRGVTPPGDGSTPPPGPAQPRSQGIFCQAVNTRVTLSSMPPATTR